MTTLVHRRPYDAFLSHAHKDQAFVDQLYRWLTEKAGFRVWYDAKELAGGALLATELQNAIEQCRGLILIASPDALKSGWVKNEYNVAMDESANSPDFRVIPLRLAEADASQLVRGIKWIDIRATHER